MKFLLIWYMTVLYRLNSILAEYLWFKQDMNGALKNVKKYANPEKCFF